MPLPLIPLQTIISCIASSAYIRTLRMYHLCSLWSTEKHALSPITTLARDLLFWHARRNQCAKSNCVSKFLLNDVLREFDPNATLIHYQ